MRVYALFHETDGDDGQIEALYLNLADAEAARLAHIRAARDAGLSIYFDPDSGDDFESWDHNWRVDVEDVYTSAPDVACPHCGDAGHRANPADDPAGVQCSACGRVGMVAANGAPGDGESERWTETAMEPNPIAAVLADMERTMNETAPDSGADAIAELTEQIETLASVIGIEVQIN